MRLSGAQIVVETLIDQKVDTIFGYPGGQVLDIYDSLYSKQDKIHHVLATHEQSAAHAADGFARSTGKVGVVIATSGAGATNLVTGIATAYLDSVPMVAITGNVATDLIGRDSFQEIDITGITIPITKHNFFVKDVNKLQSTIREAFVIASSGRPGPVLVDIPKDIQEAYADYEALEPATKEPTKKATDEDITKALELIAKASRPFIYFGGGAVRAECQEEIITLSEKINAGIGCSMMGLSELPSSTPRFLGMQGIHGHYACSKAMTKADLIIAVGVRFTDRATGNTGKFAKQAQILQLDADLAEIGKNVEVEAGFSCDIKDFLRRLNSELTISSKAKWQQEIEKLKQEEHECEQNSLPKQVIKLISDRADKDTLIVTDVGQHQVWTAQEFDFKAKRQWITSGGLGAMGFGLGAAIGACMATHKRTILITGDGSFLMNLSELQTALDEELPITIVVMNNQSLGMVLEQQKLFYSGRITQTQLKRKMDFCKVAEAFGAKGYYADSIESFGKSFANAFEQSTPTVIDLTISSEEMVYPILPPNGSFDDLIRK